MYCSFVYVISVNVAYKWPLPLFPYCSSVNYKPPTWCLIIIHGARHFCSSSDINWNSNSNRYGTSDKKKLEVFELGYGVYLLDWVVVWQNSIELRLEICGRGSRGKWWDSVWVVLFDGGAGYWESALFLHCWPLIRNRRYSLDLPHRDDDWLKHLSGIIKH